MVPGACRARRMGRWWRSVLRLQILKKQTVVRYQSHTGQSESQHVHERFFRRKHIKEPRVFHTSNSMRLLYNAEDWRPILWVVLYFFTSALAWNHYHNHIWILAVVYYLSFAGACISHNSMHARTFLNAWHESVWRHMLSHTYGHPVSTFVSGHNLSHHRYTQTAMDPMHLKAAIQIPPVKLSVISAHCCCRRLQNGLEVPGIEKILHALVLHYMFERVDASRCFPGNPFGHGPRQICALHLAPASFCAVGDCHHEFATARRLCS